MDGEVGFHYTGGAEGGQGIVLSSHVRNGGTCRMMNKVVKGYFCRAKEGLLFPLQFARKQSEKHGYEIEKTWNWKQF